MNRAYSLLEIKSIDEDQRVITGMATTPEPDRVGDVVDPMGAKFAAEIPLLWQHQHGSPVGIAKFGKPTKSGIPFTAELPNIAEPGALKEMVDMAWQSVKAKLVRAVSIGFKAIEYSFMENGGVHFQETEIYELSLVTIPANASATIQTIKNLDRESLAASGHQREVIVRLEKSAGASAQKPQSKTKSPEGSMNVAEQIRALEEKRKSLTEERVVLQTKAVDEGRTKDAAEQERFAEITSEVNAIDKELADLKIMEKDLVITAKPVDGKSDDTSAQSRDKSFASMKIPQKSEPGIEFARYAMCLIAAKGDIDKAFKIAANNIPNAERVVKALKIQSDSGRTFAEVMKANVNAGTTVDATWAAPLVDYQNFAGDFVEFLRPQTIIGRFGQAGVPALRAIPFNVRINGQTSGGAGYWVGEGAPKPLTKFDFNAVELRFAKVANIAVLTDELVRFSNPSAEALVRQALADALRARLDIDFIDPDKAAVANVSPASITNGIAPISSTGADADDIRRDIRALWAPFIAANNAPTSAVYIMSSSTALSLSLMQNALGQSEFPGITLNGGTLGGIPVIVSEYAKNDGGSSGSIVILANASDIWLADDGQIAIDASREASLQMDDAPSNNSATGTESQVVSMFQTNSVALRAERYINWQRRRSSAVSWLDAVNWGV